jgi:hypothetical protein
VVKRISWISHLTGGVMVRVRRSGLIAAFFGWWSQGDMGLLATCAGAAGGSSEKDAVEKVSVGVLYEEQG